MQPISGLVDEALYYVFIHSHPSLHSVVVGQSRIHSNCQMYTNQVWFLAGHLTSGVEAVSNALIILSPSLSTQAQAKCRHVHSFMEGPEIPVEFF